MHGLDEIVRLNEEAARKANQSSLTPEARKAVGEDTIRRVTTEALDPELVKKLRAIRVAAENIIIWVNGVLK